MNKHKFGYSLLFVSILFVGIFCQCRNDKESDDEAGFTFPVMETIDAQVYSEIRKTCENYWDLSTMIDSTFEILIYPDGYAFQCDGYINEQLYQFVIRVDKEGKWINDGRSILMDSGIIRPLVQLTTADIPTFTGLIQSKFGEIPLSVNKILPETYTACYEFRWDSEGDDFSYIDIWVAESKESAFKILEEKQKSYTIPQNLLEESKDVPAVVGDLSYSKGLEFIRDNFVVRIYTGGKFDHSITEIAQYVDAKILVSPVFMALSHIKPVIKEFKINKNPVIERNQTPLTIRVTDPNNKEITYQWRYNQESGYSGITKNNSGEYSYFSNFVNSNNTEVGITLIAINEYGFCADSTINIQIIKE